MDKSVLVSIIVRTCGNTHVLGRALQSIQHQTYRNIEVIVVEDGPNLSEQFVKNSCGDLRYVYHATGKRQGRTCAGNIGMSLATGKYLNFLDEDDILLEEHVELLVDALESRDVKAAFAIAEEHQIKVQSEKPYVFRTKRKLVRYDHPFNRLLLCYMNLFPIQSVMFSRELYEKHGGFDEELDMLEDWDLWVRYASDTDFIKVSEVTSVYYTPYKGKNKRQRDAAMKKAADRILQKHELYPINLSAGQINRDMDYILNVFNRKGLWFYLKKVRNYLLYRDI